MIYFEKKYIYKLFLILNIKKKKDDVEVFQDDFFDFLGTDKNDKSKK
jgi:hypothetical protein